MNTKTYNDMMLNILELHEAKILLQQQLLQLNAAISELHYEVIEQKYFPFKLTHMDYPA